MPDLRKTFDNILQKWGHNIVLQRRAADGRDFQNKLERHTVRHMYPANRGLPQIAQERPEGITHAVDMVYYFRYDAEPHEGDRLYEEDGRTLDKQTTWLIDYSLPMRGYGGRVEYWVVGCTREEGN